MTKRVWPKAPRRSRRYAPPARSHLAAIVESSDDAIVSTGLDGTITSWNRGAERLYGYTAAEAVGLPVTMLIPEDRLEEDSGVLARVRRGEAIEHYETARRRKDGTRVDISLTVSPIRDAGGRIIGASKIARDITERKRAEAALKEADRRKDEFLATLSHELRNPLAPLANAVGVMRQSGADAPAPRDLLDVMERQIAHLARLVDDLLEVSRITRGRIQLKKEAVRIASAAQDAVDISKPLIESRSHRLDISLPPEPLFVHGDATRIAQVIANLLNNAAKFTPRGGRIRLALAREQDQGVITVADNGIGIPVDMLGRVFEMFTQIGPAVEGAPGGLGIGLALVRQLVGLHGGTVEAHSGGPGQGSAFVVRLPLAETMQGATQPGTGTMALRGTRRVLVVDDNRDAAQTIELLLRTLGHQVATAFNGAEALARADAMRPDVVLLDIGMPDMDGFQVAQELRSRSWARDLLIVALTGWGQDAVRRKGQESGIDEHLVKPVDYAVLERLLSDPSRRTMH